MTTKKLENALLQQNNQVRRFRGKNFGLKGELQVGKKRVGRYPRLFREKAVVRMRNCDSVLELAKELGVHRSVLYQWRDQLAPLDRLEWREAEETGESPLERENRRLKQALADKTLEIDFFRGALQKIAARRQSSTKPGGTASTAKSGS
jgi:transposase-like protein